MNSLHIQSLKYNHIISIGGIGSGILFSLTGGHTLGRNESRMATLEPYRDFCKQHIIMHYIAVLLGAKPTGKFRSFPIGKVGNDEIGARILAQMSDVGMVTENISVCGNSRTLFSVCFQYPDHSGGNITTDNSASSQVSVDDINIFSEITVLGVKTQLYLPQPKYRFKPGLERLQRARKTEKRTWRLCVHRKLENLKD